MLLKKNDDLYSKSENLEDKKSDFPTPEKTSNSTAINRNSHFSDDTTGGEFKKLPASPETTEKAVEMEQLE